MKWSIPSCNTANRAADSTTISCNPSTLTSLSRPRPLTKLLCGSLKKISQATVGKKAVGANTIHHYHAYIRKALKKAVRDKIITSNPADYVNLPKKPIHQANFYDNDSLNKFLQFIKGQDIEVVALLASWFGLRRGEAAGLRWCDVDFVSNTISVRGVIRDKGESGSKIKNMHYVPRTKSQTSMRDLPMPQACIAYLKKLKHYQDNRKSLPDYNHQWDGYI